MLIARETFAQIYAEAAPLLARHWEEIAHYKDIPLDVRVAQYEAAEGIGMLRCFGARIDGVLVGYAAFFVDHAIHYAGSIQARQDVLFLIPEYRGFGLGMQLIAECDQALAAEGVQVVQQHSKNDPAIDIGPVLLKSGYESGETVYFKRLDRKHALLPSASLAEAQAAHVLRQLIAA